MIKATAPVQDDDAYRHAVRLAEALREKHFPENANWRPLPDICGVIDQIDNMTTALSRLSPTPETGLVEALENCFSIACDYTIPERAARSEIASIARRALSNVSRLED
jgi:hypothetical protein